MEPEDIPKILAFTGAEMHLSQRFDLPADAFLPLMLSLRTGGDWCYASGTVRSMAIMKKTSVYDENRRLGSTIEEIYLFVNPRITAREGEVHRLEKCGEETSRLLVVRPYRIGIGADRILRTTVRPLEREIRTEDSGETGMHFEGATAYNIAHEMEHLEKREIAGRQLWEFRFTVG